MALPPLPSGATKELPPLPPGATTELPPLPKGATKENAKEESDFYDKAKAFGKSALESIPSAGGALAGAETGAAIGSFAGPVGTLAGGLIGGIGGVYLGEKGGEVIGEMTPEEVKKDIGFGKEQRETERKQHRTASFLGSLAPDVVALGPSLVRATKYGAGLLRSPEPLATVKDAAEVGEKGFKLLQDKAGKLLKTRQTEADINYENAFNVARQAQAKGEPFAVSPQGRNLIAELENDKRVIAGGKEFEKGEEKIAGIDRLIKAIKGTTTGGGTAPVGKGLVSSKLTKKLPTKTTEKDIEALVEELRFLRDVDAKGKPYEAYGALSADYKRKLIDKLEKQLYDWAPEYKAADKAYKDASAKLSPFKTQLMSGALKGEKFNPADLVASPEQFGNTFFKDKNSVENLIEATGDKAEVARLAKEHIASVFANKTPQQIQAIVRDRLQAPWMKEAGIYDDVVEYANKATSAQDKQKILSNLKRGAVLGIGATAIGGPAYYGIRRGLGL